MGEIVDAFDRVYRDNKVQGVPASGLNEPSKPDIRGTIGPVIERAIEGAAAGVTQKATWVGLAAVPGTRNGQPGRVPSTDAGTHTDPVVGGTKPNAGEYAWSVSPAGWQWISALPVDVTDSLPPMLRVADDPVTGAGLVATGERFAVPGPDGLSLYERSDSANLYNPATKRAGYYVNTGSGNISVAAGWVVSAFIPVTPGQSYTISTNTPRQAGLSFFSSASDSAGVSGSVSSATTPAGVTVVAPVGGNFLALTVSSPSFAEPTQIMVNAGASALAYRPFGQDWFEIDTYASTELIGRFAELVVSANLYNPAGRRDGKYVSVSNGNIVSAAGWACSGFIPIGAGVDVTISSNTPRQGEVGFFSSATDTGASTGKITEVANTSTTVTTPAGTNFMVITTKSTLVAEPTEIMVNLGTTALPYDAFGATHWRIKPDALPDSGEPVTVEAASFTLRPGSSESTIDSSLSGHRIRNTFVLGAPLQLFAAPQRMNLQKIYLDATLVRSFSDDIAPDVAMGTNIAGNHGWMLGTCTATAHGKGTPDEGSIWATGGNDYVLVKVVDANTLAIARRTTNDVPVTGAYTHVSGAANTAGFTVSAVTAQQWYPSHENYTVRVLVDGREVSLVDGDFTYTDTVQIVETSDVLTRQSIIDWWIANGGASGGIQPNGTPAYTITTTHAFDRDGQLTIFWDWVFLQTTTQVDYLRGLQASLVNSPSEIYIPGAIPMTYQGNPVDFSRKAAANISLAGNQRIAMTPANFQAAGECGHRCVSLWPTYVFEMGFMPVADAAYAVRRTRVSGGVMDLAANGKQYMRLLDQGPATAAAGDHYSAACFRHVMVRDAARTAFTVVRTPGGAAWIYADWHDKAGLDRLPIPADLTGRAITIEDSRNVSVKSSQLAGSLPVMVSATGDYGYVVARVDPA